MLHSVWSTKREFPNVNVNFVCDFWNFACFFGIHVSRGFSGSDMALSEHIFPQKRFFPKFTIFSKKFFEFLSCMCCSPKKFWTSYNEALCSQNVCKPFFFFHEQFFFFQILLKFEHQRICFFNFHVVAKLPLDRKKLSKKKGNTKSKKFFFLFVCTFCVLFYYS